MSQPPVAPGQWHSRPSRPPQLQNLPYVAPSSVPHVPHQTEPLPAHFTGSGPSLNAFPPQYANAAAPRLPPLSHPAASPAHQLQPHPAHSSGNFSGSFSPSFSRHFQAFQAPFQTPFQTPSQTQTHFQTPYQTPFSAHLQGSGPRLGGYPAQFNPSDRVTSSGVPQAPYGFAQQTATQTLQPTQPHTYPFPNPGSFVPQADPYSTQPDQGALSYQYTQQNVQRRNQPARNRRPAVSRATASESRALGGTDDNEEPRRRRTATDIADEAIRRRRMAQTMVVASWRKMLENYCEPVSITSLPEDERACVICYNEFGKKTPEGFTERPVRLIKCKHVFGEHCILLWMKRRKTCPYCREDLGSIRNPSSTRAFIGIMTIGEAYTARLAEEMNQRDPRNPIHLARPSSAGYA